MCDEPDIITYLPPPLFQDHTTKRYMLTDPAIHCVAVLHNETGVLSEGCFDEQTDKGPAGFHSFFSSHTCNNVCRKLGLADNRTELINLRARAMAGELPGHPDPLDLTAAPPDAG